MNCSEDVNASDSETHDFEALADHFNNSLTLSVKMDILETLEREGHKLKTFREMKPRTTPKRPACEPLQNDLALWKVSKIDGVDPVKHKLKPPSNNEVSPATKRRNMMMKSSHIAEQPAAAFQFKKTTFKHLSKMFNDAGEFIGLPFEERFGHPDPLGLNAVLPSEEFKSTPAPKAFLSNIPILKSLKNVPLLEPPKPNVYTTIDKELVHELLLNARTGSEKKEGTKKKEMIKTYRYKFENDLKKSQLPYPTVLVEATSNDSQQDFKAFEDELMQFKLPVPKTPTILCDDLRKAVESEIIGLQGVPFDDNLIKSDLTVPLTPGKFISSAIKEEVKHNAVVKIEKKDSKLPIPKITSKVSRDEQEAVLEMMKYHHNSFKNNLKESKLPVPIISKTLSNGSKEMETKSLDKVIAKVTQLNEQKAKLIKLVDGEKKSGKIPIRKTSFKAATKSSSISTKEAIHELMMMKDEHVPGLIRNKGISKMVPPACKTGSVGAYSGSETSTKRSSEHSADYSYVRGGPKQRIAHGAGSIRIGKPQKNFIAKNIKQAGLKNNNNIKSDNNIKNSNNKLTKQARPVEKDDEDMLPPPAKKMAVDREEIAKQWTGVLVKKDNRDKDKKKKKEQKKRKHEQKHDEDVEMKPPPVKMKFTRIAGTSSYSVVN